MFNVLLFIFVFHFILETLRRGKKKKMKRIHDLFIPDSFIRFGGERDGFRNKGGHKKKLVSRLIRLINHNGKIRVAIFPSQE